MGILPRICLATRGTSYKKPQPTPKKKKKTNKKQTQPTVKKTPKLEKRGKNGKYGEIHAAGMRQWCRMQLRRTAWKSGLLWFQQRATGVLKAFTNRFFFKKFNKFGSKNPLHD